LMMGAFRDDRKKYGDYVGEIRGRFGGNIGAIPF
jgi:hypothetical protein